MEWGDTFRSVTRGQEWALAIIFTALLICAALVTVCPGTVWALGEEGRASQPHTPIHAQQCPAAQHSHSDQEGPSFPRQYSEECQARMSNLEGRRGQSFMLQDHTKGKDRQAGGQKRMYQWVQSKLSEDKSAALDNSIN